MKNVKSEKVIRRVMIRAGTAKLAEFTVESPYCCFKNT